MQGKRNTTLISSFWWITYICLVQIIKCCQSPQPGETKVTLLRLKFPLLQLFLLDALLNKDKAKLDNKEFGDFP